MRAKELVDVFQIPMSRVGGMLEPALEVNDSIVGQGF